MEALQFADGLLLLQGQQGAGAMEAATRRSSFRWAPKLSSRWASAAAAVVAVAGASVSRWTLPCLRVRGEADRSPLPVAHFSLAAREGPRDGGAATPGDAVLVS